MQILFGHPSRAHYALQINLLEIKNEYVHLYAEMKMPIFIADCSLLGSGS